MEIARVSDNVAQNTGSGITEREGTGDIQLVGGSKKLSPRVSAENEKEEMSRHINHIL